MTTERANAHWTVEALPWEALEPQKADPSMLKVAKAAALVEYNGNSYADYLCNIFHDDPAFCAAARQWAREEVQHGQALGQWAQRVDPQWDFMAAVDRFRQGYRIDVEAAVSKRGSRSGELVSRCIVETGTSSYYTALAEEAQEPVFKRICQHIAADELRHYKLFYNYLKLYLEKERLGRWQRLMISLSRIEETEDDELAYAYYAANHWMQPYDRSRNYKEYTGLAYSYYRPHHLERMVGMVFKASGLKPHGFLHRWAARYAYRRMHAKAAAFGAAA
jgi:rubrerythrin